MNNINKDVADFPLWKRLAEENKPYYKHVPKILCVTENDGEFYDGKMQLNFGETQNGMLLLVSEQCSPEDVGLVLNKDQCIEIKKMIERIYPESK